MSILLQAGILSASLQVVLDKFANFALKETDLLLGVDDNLKKLERTVLKIQALLDDAEERSVIDKSWWVWLQDLKKACYDADDLLDEISLGLDELTRADQNQVRNMVLSSFKLSIPHKIGEIQEKLEAIVREGDNLFMLELVKLRQSKIVRRPHCASSSLIDESSVIGRDDDKKEIIDMLLSEESGVISIVGMGGIGKTTLAQLVYNDESLVRHFDLRMWVHVSVDFDLKRITRSIIESATKKKIELLDLDPMQVILQKLLKDKKFLMVLDDMWNENFSDWDLLQSPFGVGSRGSKILVTTRSSIVSSIVGTTKAHYLQGLSDSDCRTLIEQKAMAFTEGDLDKKRNFNSEKMASKCKGLPLAAKAVGSILRFKLDIEERELWDLLEDKNEVFSVLRLSYHYLPADLKKCFAYCSIFPKDYEFEKDYLVQLWMAEGFIQPKGRRRIEDIANDYFDNLLQTSFFKRPNGRGQLVGSVNTHDSTIYKMHDLIHKLAQSVSVDICFQMGDEMSHSYLMLRNARHLSLLCENVQQRNLEAFICKYESLRTLLLFGRRAHIGQVHCNLFLKLRRLRVLDLSDTGIMELPDSIDNLKHLRYLSVSGTLIKKLPESIANLYGLETLKLKSCMAFRQLPKHMSNLTSLRHLHLDKNCQLSSMPLDFGKLTRLQTLHAFIVGNEKGCRIRELKDMKDIRGSISITHLENVESFMEAKEAMLDKKPNLDKIELQWCEFKDQLVETSVLEGLQPHENLRELHITSFGGFLIPNWVTRACNLETLYLQNCRSKYLPLLGKLQSLKFLHIEKMLHLTYIGCQFCGSGMYESFPSLISLEFHDMPELIEWSGLNASNMPHLRELKIADCPKLVSLPALHYLASLKQLEISGCPVLQSLPAEGLPIQFETLVIMESPILEERCKHGEGKDWWKISTIRTLEINYEKIPMQ